jgi:tetratricopeptide (TPR) repeat protein
MRQHVPAFEERRLSERQGCVPAAQQAEGQLRAVSGCVLCLVIACGPIVGLGCRTLRTNRHTRNLTEARQLSLRGAGMLQQNNHREAGPLFSEALTHSPADERAHWGMAEVLWAEGEQLRAIGHMTRAAELDGKNPDYLVRLGEMHVGNGNWDDAFEQAELAISFNRQHAEAWALKGKVLRQQGRKEDALDCYQRALIHNPTNSEARVALAGIYQELGRPQRALATLDQLADSRPTEDIPARAWLLKGEALASLGEQVDAKECLRQAALCADDRDSQLLLDLAQLQYRTGELAEARLCLGRALQNNPQDPHARQLQSVLDQSFEGIAGPPHSRSFYQVSTPTGGP